MKIYVIRHGETYWNRLGKIQGQTDTDLTKEGYELADRTGEALRDRVMFDVCFTSPLKRAAATAEAILKHQQAYKDSFCSLIREGYDQKEKLLECGGIPMISDERIKEIRFGSWEGLIFGDPSCPIRREEFVRYFEAPGTGIQPQNAETIPQLVERTSGFLEDIAARPMLRDKTILVTTHGAAMRAMMYYLYENKHDFWQGHVPVNCEMMLLEKDTKDRLYISAGGFVPANGEFPLVSGS